MDEEERRLQAEALGIDPNDLTLAPNEEDMQQQLLNSNRKRRDSGDSNASITTDQMDHLVSSAGKSQLRRQTYNQFKMQDPRQRGMSRRFSDACTAEDGLQGEDAILHFMFSKEIRMGKIRSFLVWNLFNLVILIYVTILIGVFWQQWDKCIRELSTWLIGYLFIHSLHLVRRFILIGFWWKAKDPTLYEVQVNLFFFVFVFLPEVGWYIYGNTFIYSKHEFECRQENPEEWKLWFLSLVLIIQGYIVMLVALGVILFASGAYYMYRQWSQLEPEEESQESGNSRIDQIVQITQQVPMLNHAQEFGLRRYDSRIYNRYTTRNFERQATTRDSNFLKVHKGQFKSEVVKVCNICNKPFKDDDQIVECMLIHVFHVQCFENAKQGAQESRCPIRTCGQNMQLMTISNNQQVSKSQRHQFLDTSFKPTQDNKKRATEADMSNQKSVVSSGSVNESIEKLNPTCSNREDPSG